VVNSDGLLSAMAAGMGAAIATDDVGGVHFQQIKVVDGTLDSTNVWKISTDGAALLFPPWFNSCLERASSASGGDVVEANSARYGGRRIPDSRRFCM